MKRTTISLDDPLLQDVQRMAEERQTSVAALVREALKEKIATSDADIGFVDAAVLAVVERMNEPKVATLDHRHFAISGPVTSKRWNCSRTTGGN